MSEVGVASIVLGVVIVSSRGPLLVAPAATLRWFEGMIRTDGRIRALGVVALALGALLVRAGVSEENVLATILSLFGWVAVVFTIPALLLFPAVYRFIGQAVVPANEVADLTGWRVLGLAGVVIGGLLIYFGALAL